MHTASDFVQPPSPPNTTVSEMLLAQLTQAYALIDKLRDEQAQAYQAARIALDLSNQRTREANDLESVIYRARCALRDSLSPEDRIAAALALLDVAYYARLAPDTTT
jgi:hypothetical protein